MLTRYDREWFAEKVEGYYLPRPNEAAEVAFARAQAELIAAMEARLAVARAGTLEDWQPNNSPKLPHSAPLKDSA